LIPRPGSPTDCFRLRNRSETNRFTDALCSKWEQQEKKKKKKKKKEEEEEEEDEKEEEEVWLEANLDICKAL
jgi:hypothetical protein